MAERRRRSWRAVIAVAVCVVAVGALLFGVLKSNIVYYRTVPEALVAAKDSDHGGRFRLGGIVLKGSIEPRSNERVAFTLTDGSATVSVLNDGSPPDLFREGESVLCEGAFDKAGKVFLSDRITIRHGNEYKPPAASSSSTAETSTAAGE